MQASSLESNWFVEYLSSPGETANDSKFDSQSLDVELRVQIYSPNLTFFYMITHLELTQESFYII